MGHASRPAHHLLVRRDTITHRQHYPCTPGRSLFWQYCATLEKRRGRQRCITHWRHHHSCGGPQLGQLYVQLPQPDSLTSRGNSSHSRYYRALSLRASLRRLVRGCCCLQCTPRGTSISKQVYRGVGTPAELTTGLQHSLTANVHILEVFAVYSVRIAAAKGYSTSWKTISVPGYWSASGSAQLPF